MYGYIRMYRFVQRMCRHGILNTTYAYKLLYSALKDNYTAIHWTMKSAYNLQIYHNNHRPIIVPLRCQWQRLSPVRLLPRCSHHHLVPPCWLQLTHQAAFWAPPPLHQWPPWATGGTEAPLWLASIHIQEKGWVLWFQRVKDRFGKTNLSFTRWNQRTQPFSWLRQWRSPRFIHTQVMCMVESTLGSWYGVMHTSLQR